MENGNCENKWDMKNGKLDVRNEMRKMRCEKWEIGNRKWEMRNGKQDVRTKCEKQKMWSGKCETDKKKEGEMTNAKWKMNNGKWKVKKAK